MIILFLLVWGMVAGWVAHLILGRGRPDWGELFVAGIAGSFLGGLVVSLLMGDGLALRVSGIIGSILGSIVVLALYDRFRLRRKEEQRAARLKASRSGRHQPRSS